LRRAAAGIRNVYGSERHVDDRHPRRVLTSEIMPDHLHHPALLTDLYELTMAAAYFENNFSADASFELFVRSLPKQRGYLIAAGLEQALDYLQNLRFQDDEIEYLKRLPVLQHINSAFFDYLRDFRFTGDVWAIPEGTPVFGEEPLLRVTAPIIQAQVVETCLLSTITFQTMIASKAARVVREAQGRSVVEFGSRRAHGPNAGVLAARAAYIGGCAGTSNVEAGRRFGVPVFGTLAHSFVMAYTDEEEAFREFLRLYPAHGVLLVDTYDTLAAVEKIIHSGLRPTAIRMDSGDLLQLSKQIRKRLDRAGMQETQIFASGDLDEFKIKHLLAHGAQVDSFGVGTSLATSIDAPALGGVYKLVDLESKEGISVRAKLSEQKVTYPGRKQVYRFRRSNGVFREDMIACEGEGFPDGEPLLQRVMQKGECIADSPDLKQIQEHARREIANIPPGCTRIVRPARYTVHFSECLQSLLWSVRKQMKQGAAGKNRAARITA
jgi:nicotinate phosphoribosyltransferase